MQNYHAPACGASPAGAAPTLPALIERLQNIHLLTLDAPKGDYALHRQVDELTVNLTDVIGRLDRRILDATTPAAL